MVYSRQKKHIIKLIVYWNNFIRNNTIAHSHNIINNNNKLMDYITSFTSFFNNLKEQKQGKINLYVIYEIRKKTFNRNDHMF